MTGIIIIFLVLWFLFFFLLVPSNVSAAGFNRKHDSCSPQSCGNFNNIRCPFTLKGANNPHKCSTPIELVCDENNRIIYSPLPSKNFYIIDISYENRTILIVDTGLQKDNCSSMPQYSLTSLNLRNMSNNGGLYRSSSKQVFYMNCSARVDSPYYVDTSPCINAASSSSSSTYSYVIVSSPAQVKDLKSSCTFWMASAMKESYDVIDHSYFDIHNKMLNGFELYWGFKDGQSEGCFIRKLYGPYLTTLLRLRTFEARDLLLWLLIRRFILWTPIVAAIMIHTLRRRRQAVDPGVEDYLLYYSNKMPIRYSYYDVKRMTKNFKEKLGQGGYGSVFKGVLSNNCSVAIKVMNTTKGNGQEFINEVASIGRIHHVNVVRLLGFVAERSKRALIYEFMPNGSLEKYIFPQEGNLVNPLSRIKMYEIALGIARGMDYLHRGCDMQILHFDIKPHNILLDENFIPKISDFGLAKLYSADDSIVSMTTARGTYGYFAPELLYRNIGGVSYKSDVYSFGVMLLEMVGRRKNINAFAENPSQIYFPSWIYDQLNRGKDIEMENIADEKETELAKKMIIVGLWCIQMKPIDRPSMLKVIEMLEGGLELLQMPPKPNVLPDEDGDAISID